MNRGFKWLHLFPTPTSLLFQSFSRRQPVFTHSVYSLPVISSSFTTPRLLFGNLPPLNSVCQPLTVLGENLILTTAPPLLLSLLLHYIVACWEVCHPSDLILSPLQVAAYSLRKLPRSSLWWFWNFAVTYTISRLRTWGFCKDVNSVISHDFLVFPIFWYCYKWYLFKNFNF